MGIRQRVEILKALYRGVKILVLDEPTTNLTPQEVDGLFESLRAMVNEGLSVIFITHNPHHAYTVGDRFIILKRGKTLGIWNKDEITREDMVRSMSGADELEALTHELDGFARREEAVGQAPGGEGEPPAAA